jgi:actin-like ATPase involved in cell morphogenesis
MTWYLGIDLGTTFTAAAICGDDGRARMVGLADHGTAVPSVLLLTREGPFLVGDAAVRRATDDPDRVARETKRRVGDPAPIVLGGSPYSAALLQAHLLRWAVDKVVAEQGTSPAGIAVTHPASWGPYKIDELRSAIRQAEVEVTTFLPEPVAAATAYAAERQIRHGANIAVYDLGGGTFDCCVVRRDEDSGAFEVVGTPEGVDRLGGIDFDEAVFDHVRRSLGGVLDGLDADDPATLAGLAHLRRECTSAKETLSADTTATISVILPNVATTVRIGRTEFEAMIRPALAETITALRRTIRNAGLTPDDLDAVLLVGGSSRIPQVSQLVSAELGRPVAVDAHPKDAIALGAALAVAAAAGVALEPVAPPVVPEAVAVEPEVAPVADPQPWVAPDPTPAGGGGRKLLIPVIAVVVVIAAIAAALALGGGGGDGDDGVDASADETDGQADLGDGDDFHTQEAVVDEAIEAEDGNAVTRSVSVPDTALLVIRGSSTADLVISVLGDDEDSVELLRVNDLVGAVDPGLVDLVGDSRSVDEIMAENFVTLEGLEPVELCRMDNAQATEEEILYLPFLTGHDVTVLFTSYNGNPDADGNPGQSATLNATIDVLDYDLGDTDDAATLAQFIRDDTRLTTVIPELT